VDIGAAWRESLDPPDNHHPSAAVDWLGLGNRREANEELEKITAALRSHPDVLEVRWLIYSHAKKWDMCLDIAEAIIKLDPDRPDAWLHRAFALHGLKRTQEALDQLLPVADRFPKVWTIPYNLACDCAHFVNHCLQNGFWRRQTTDGARPEWSRV
jgi:tetratricopeptide (TPR) repeat protein